MTYEFYKVMHLASLFMVFSSIGAYFVSGIAGGGKAFPGKRFAGLLHGIGLFLVLLSGFGLLARLSLFDPLPGWAYIKMLIWLFMGGIVVLATRKPQWAKGVWLLTLIVGGCAAYLARYKPF